ncbi:hypothetical protein CLJ1_2239 [Pseudomonas paraeruginosa]|nr:hypothetical protein CLJ1_2239 [Pseudomonas aeruginosa]
MAVGPVHHRRNGEAAGEGGVVGGRFWAHRDFGKESGAGRGFYQGWGKAGAGSG